MIDFDFFAGQRFCWGFALCWLEQHADENGRIEGSMAQWASAWTWPKSNVVTFLAAMERAGKIKHESRTMGRTGGTVLTILKHEEKTDGAKDAHTRGHTKATRFASRDHEGFDEALALYDKAANFAGWPQVSTINATRRGKLNARLREVGLDAWRDMLREACRSPMMKGDNDRGWRPNFDWFLSPTNFTKVAEGFYADRRGAAPRRDARPDPGEAVMRSLLEE